MKIAVSAQGTDRNAQIDPRFGRAACFHIFDTDTGQTTTCDNTVNQAAAHGAGIQTVKTLVDAGVTTVITGNVGPKAMNALQTARIRAFRTPEGLVTRALELFLAGQLPAIAD